jgi:dTDP-4-dehydrorhamnose reductase
MKIGIIGANGQLGNDLVLAFSENHNVIELNHDKIDISNIDSVNNVLKSTKPDILINTAALHNVDVCEQNEEMAFAVNAAGARNLALVALDLELCLIHISTDYVFDGSKEKPYLETDRPNPLNVYGNTKLSGEYFVSSMLEKHFIVRTSGLYGKAPCRGKGLNFVNLMLKLSNERDEIRVVEDEIITPTYTADLAQQIKELSQTEHYGLFHATSQGACTWFEFAAKIFEYSGSAVKLSVADTSEFPAKVPRPKYSVLDNQALDHFGINTMDPWDDAVKQYLLDINS